MSDTLHSDALNNPTIVALEHLGKSVFGMIRKERTNTFMNLLDPKGKLKSDPSLEAIHRFLASSPASYAIQSTYKSIGGRKLLNFAYDRNKYINNKYIKKITNKVDKKILHLASSKSKVKRIVGKTAKFGREFYVEEVK